MNVLINGVLVEIIIAPFADNVGWILAAFIKDKGEKAEALHIEMAKLIRTVYPAVMDNSPYLPDEVVFRATVSVQNKNLDNQEPEEEPQIRLLECEPLRFIDMLRMLGFSVVEKVIQKK